MGQGNLMQIEWNHTTKAGRGCRIHNILLMEIEMLG